jgi:hypothetical protein
MRFEKSPGQMKQENLNKIKFGCLKSMLEWWIEEARGEVEHVEYAGFVPMFSPDWLARGMKTVEPLVECIPGVNRLACAVHVILSRRLHSR